MIIDNYGLLRELMKHLKHLHHKIVTTNGCFDILHAGHIHLLREAKNHGDVLVVLVNTDASIQRLKGEHRPIVPLDWRMKLLDRLDMVDVVVPFSESEPTPILSYIAPHVHVKEADYQGRPMPERAYIESHDGVIAFASIDDDISSSTIINKM